MTFIRNAWYAAARVEEVGARPFARTILNDPVVLFRDQEGTVGALLDACPHRGVPLSMGEVTDGMIRCHYHAMMFDIGGVCRHNPHSKGPPERVRGKAFPLVERHGFIWIWMGDPALADESAIVDYSLFGPDSNYTVANDYLKIEADYRLVIDNLMDLAHAEFVHPETVGSPGAHKVEQAEIIRGEDSITVRTLWPDLPPNGVNRPI
jgi:phenylpropionate dioxygenase-like ring-hydroxylating dioxygenase large terminal subunit